MNPFELNDVETDEVSMLDEKQPDFLDGLNPEQYDAVTTTEGPLLVLSGAGTGKTRVLTTRLAYIIQQRLAAPWQCLAVTFTNKASKEMSERLEKMIGKDALSVWLGTFHKLGLRMLRQHYDIVNLNKDFVILGSDDSERICKQLMQADGVDIKQWSPAGLNAVIQRWKDRGLSPSAVTPKEDSGFLNGGALSYYHRYQTRLKELNAVDFGDLLLLPLEIFKMRPDIAGQYQRQFKYILVDEYQDTNVAQYLWLRLLAQGHNNLCCVGDDDQSIYSWRGAEVENILRFSKDFSSAKTIRLERNYRSTAHILGAASALISNNESRLGKTLYVAPERDGTGDRVQVNGYWSGAEEAEKVVEAVEYEMRSTSLSDMAVLVRAGFQTRAFEEALIRSGIPYQVIGDFKFYEREEIKDAIAYLRLLANPSDDLAFLRIVNKPRRGLGEVTLQKLTECARQKYMSLLDAIDWAELKPSVRSTLTDFKNNINRWKQRLIDGDGLAEVTKDLLEESGYNTMWRMDKSPDAPGRLENLNELISVMKGEFEDLNTFIEHASLVMDSENQTGQELFTVMTLHASKGLEFNTVFLPGWEEGLFPHAKSLDEGGGGALEEERRLAYVGLTRARKKAFISYAANRRVYGGWQNALPSRFIDELPYEHIDMKSTVRGRSYDYEPKFSTKPSYQKWEEPQEDNYEEDAYEWGKSSGSIYQTIPQTTSKIKKYAQSGTRVYHEKFGYGTIYAQDGEKLDVAFDKHGRKKILSRFVTQV